MFDYDVFLSFSAKDTELVKPIWQRLTSSGLRVFWADQSLQQNAGKSWFAMIQSALVGSRDLVVYWSQNARESAWVEEEYQAFYSQCYLPRRSARRLILLCSEASLISTLPPFLRQLQVVRSLDDLVKAVGGVDLDQLRTRNAELQQLVDALSAENAALKSLIQNSQVPPSEPAATNRSAPEVANAASFLSSSAKEIATTDRVFVLRDTSGGEHLVTGIHIKFGPAYGGSGLIRSCRVQDGAVVKDYYFSTMSSLTFTMEPDRALVRFTLPERVGSSTGEIRIEKPEWKKVEPTLHFTTPEGDWATIKLSDVDWPVRRLGL